MKQIAWVFAAVFVLNGCGGDGRPTELDLASAQDVDESRYAADDDWGDEYVEDGGPEDDPELGVLRINLAGEQHETQGYCSLQMTRMQRGEIATVHANLSVRSFDDQPGADSESGELNINWGTDPDNGMVPMGINYEPPASPDIDVYDLGWVQDVESTKTASLAITVDGEPYNFATGDMRGTDRYENAPHLWQTTLAVLSNLVNPRDDGQVFRGQGRFEYDGLCTVSIRVINDE